MNSCRARGAERHAALAEVQAVYFDLATRPIDRRCTLRTECCHFKLTGLTPFLTKGEGLLAAKALRASGRRTIPDRKDGACPLLDPKTSRCLIYQARPFGCRTHFCEAAGGPYSRRDVLDLIRRLERIDAEVGGNGPRPLPDAVAEALRMLA
jgi:uncharacterized protein